MSSGHNMGKAHGALLFKAGDGAYRAIRDGGFEADIIHSMAGASGGAKWLVLSQLDRVVADTLLPAIHHPLHLIGSSIGAWRFACFAQPDPQAAIDRFETAYIEQSYSARPDIHEITRKSREILDTILGDDGASHVLSHPTVRCSVMTVRSRHLATSDRRALLGTGLLMAMSANAVHRRALGGFFERAVFFDGRDRPACLDATGFPLISIPLSVDNYPEAVRASGSIPMVLSGVRDIPGAPAGTYRDGGIIDYHLDLPTSAESGITLYPHFFDWLKPGWFDRQLRWRRVRREHFDRTVLICPSPKFIAGLPGARVPNRSDFRLYSEPERIRIWREVTERCRVLADELYEVLERGQLAERLQPLFPA